MPLTPEDVHKKTFTPVRLREGYDMAEVDQFLDEVEAELVRLHQERSELRAKLGVPGAVTPTAGTSKQAENADGVTASASPSVPELPVVRTVAEASGAAARLLELATNNADQLVSEAKADADKILAAARTAAETLEGEAKSKAERLDSESRARAERLDAETTDRRQQLFGQLEQDKQSLARALEDMRTFETEYRNRLRSYFESQLKALDGKIEGDALVSPLTDGETPRRLRELLGEDASG